MLRRCFRMGIFNYAGRDFETLWSSNAENYNQFSGDKKHKQCVCVGGGGEPFNCDHIR